MKRQETDSSHAYWRRNLTMIATLLTLWFIVTFVVGFYAGELTLSFFGWPFSFWMGAQGAPVIYVILIAAYAIYMNRLDRKASNGDQARPNGEDPPQGT